MRVLVFLSLCALCAAYVDYSGYVVERFTANTRRQMKMLQELPEIMEVDMWKEAEVLGDTTDVMVSPELHDDLMFLAAGIPHRVMISDVGKLIEEERTRTDGRSKRFDWENYYTWDEIYDWIYEQADHCASCDLSVIGQSYLGKDLLMLKFLGGSSGKTIWLDAAIHAREWVSGGVITYIIDKFINEPDNEDVQDLLSAFDWHILPMVNPDGYDYTWTDDRMWRKTRSPNDGSACVGTDANRNFDFEWDTPGGSSTNPCSSTYRGAYAHSEIEVETQTSYMEQNVCGNMDFGLTIHSYSQLFYQPWGYDPSIEIEDQAESDALCQVGVDAIYDVHGMTYTYTKVSGANSGTTRDWMKGGCGAKFSYTLELRDTGEYGFILPEDQILPTAEEAWAGLVAMARVTMNANP